MTSHIQTVTPTATVDALRKYAILTMLTLAAVVVITPNVNAEEPPSKGVYTCYDNWDGNDWRATLAVPPDGTDEPVANIEFDDSSLVGLYVKEGVSQRWVLIDETTTEETFANYQFFMGGRKTNGRFQLHYFDYSSVDDGETTTSKFTLYCKYKRSKK